MPTGDGCSKSVYYANTVLDEFSGKIPSAEEKNLFETVRGEAYALRAYCYFYLVNLYAENSATENMEKPGVPMPLRIAVGVRQNTQNNVRVAVGKVWGDRSRKTWMRRPKIWRERRVKAGIVLIISLCRLLRLVFIHS